MRKLIISDLDGTLVDTRKVNYLSYKKACNLFGYELNEEYFKNECNGKYYMEFLPMITTYDKWVLDQIHTIKQNVYHEYLPYARLNCHLVEIIKLLSGKYHIALVTTASKKNTGELLKLFNLTGIFELILTREDVSKVKPDPEGFIKAIDFFCVRTSDTLIFEDSDVGEKAAISCGASCYLVKGYS